MKYIALLRGINVGGNRKVEMQKLKSLFESSAYTNVVTYLNSGNVIFESDKGQVELSEEIPGKLKEEFGFEIPVLIKREKEIKEVAEAIPEEWTNDKEQKTDVAYLFDEIDSKSTIDELPVNKEYLNIFYLKGAIVWNVKRKDYNKSRLNKIASSKLYKFMTVRNVNTARYLAGKR